MAGLKIRTVVADLPQELKNKLKNSLLIHFLIKVDELKINHIGLKAAFMDISYILKKLIVL